MAKFVNPFPPLKLSGGDEETLENLAASLVDECVMLYAQHLEQAKDYKQLDAQRWKHVKSREDVHVYHERPGFSKATNDAGLPTLLAIGTIVGDLDDVMYGVVNHTLDMMRIKTSYVEDRIVNGAVLATLVAPSESDPYRYLGIKWSVTGVSPIIRTFFKNRDSLYLESTGVGALESGERIGYQLLHSVKFPEIGEAPGGESVRSNMSICCIYRQVGANIVQLFMRGYLDPAGGLTRSVVTATAADVMVSVWKNVYCAQLKKLAWAIRRRRERRQTSQIDRDSKDSVPDSIAAAAANPDTCSVCKKKALLRTAHGSTCRLCFLPVCRSCCIRKSLSFIGWDHNLIQQRISFCKRCFARVAATNAHSVATNEIATNDSFGGYESATSGSSSPSTIGSYSTRSGGDWFF